jgi:hypothetical protein
MTRAYVENSVLTTEFSRRIQVRTPGGKADLAGGLAATK